MYKVGVISEACCTIPLILPLVAPLVIPLCLENPSPVPEPLLLTWNPSFACGGIPVHSGPRLLVYWPPPVPLPSPSSFPAPQRFPISNMCPPTATLRHRLHIVRYTRKPCIISSDYWEIFSLQGTSSPIFSETCCFWSVYSTVHLLIFELMNLRWPEEKEKEKAINGTKTKRAGAVWNLFGQYFSNQVRLKCNIFADFLAFVVVIGIICAISLLSNALSAFVAVCGQNSQSALLSEQNVNKICVCTVHTIILPDMLNLFR
jgi:hypothetical protein